jgi:hypothetical protein
MVMIVCVVGRNFDRAQDEEDLIVRQGETEQKPTRIVSLWLMLTERESLVMDVRKKACSAYYYCCSR